MKTIEYGYVVEASEARGGGRGHGIFLSELPPVGLSGLQDARFFTPAHKGEACGLAYWQLGTVRDAVKVDGVIKLI